jgi:hypothetical protein
MRSIRWSPGLGPPPFFPNRSLASIFGCITGKCNLKELIFPFAARKFTVVHVQHSLRAVSWLDSRSTAINP